jgi:thioredoxin 1
LYYLIVSTGIVKGRMEMSTDRISICLAILLILPLLSTVSIVNADSGNSIHISELNDSTVNGTLKDYPLFVLDCYVPQCGPCTVLNSTLLELSGELNPQLAIGRINVHENNVTKNRYRIFGYPTLLIFKNGTLADKQIGFRSKLELVDFLKKSKPGLNASHVNLVAQPQVITPSEEIALTGLGASQPVLPMLVNDSNLDSALNKYSFFVLMVYADWCGFCKRMNGTVSGLSADLKGQVAFGLINAEKNNETRNKYNITAFPTLMIFKNGTLVETQIGYKSEPEFASILKRTEPKLDISHVNITAQPQAPVALSPSMPSSKQAMISSGSDIDVTLRYLDKILNTTQCNRTSGVTINVFIINGCPGNGGNSAEARV